MAKTFSNLDSKFSDPPIGAAPATRFDATVLSELKKTAKLKELPLADIEPDPTQPRKDFDEAALATLADDITRRGVLQPILVYHAKTQDPSLPARFALLAGERRWRAAKLAGLTTIPCLALPSEPTPQEKKLIQFSENDKRAGLNPIEEAEFFQALQESSGMGVREMARELSVDHTKISRALKLLKLPAFIADALRDGSLKAAQGYALADYDNPDAQQSAFDALLKGQTTAAALSGGTRTTRQPSVPSNAPSKTHKTKTIDGLTFTMTGPVKFTNKDMAERARRLADKLDPPRRVA